MALTKLPKDGLATDSVSTSQIEDGTVQNQEFADGTLTNAKLADSTIANAKLSNSSFTINGTSIALGASGSVADGEFVDWQSVVTSNTTMVAGRGYFVNTTSGAITMTLPSSATIGDTIAIKDYAGTFATNNLTIGRNSHKIQGNTNDSILTTNRAQITLVYADATKGWLFTDEHNVADLQQSPYVTATGGTVSNTGDYRIHTFNSSSNFVVSDAGTGVPTSGKVDYMVIAGGGGGGSDAGGGGGAGGYRESAGTDTGSYTVSPLGSGVPSITVTAQTYPITVGGGGGSNSRGSNSIFSTITSTGGGSGPGTNPGGERPGGSGGGGRYTTPGGTGNTPPVSPPQGNPGGNSIPPAGAFGGGGGGGATAPGSTTNPSGAGNGGAGATSNINGTGTTRAGGGGGGGGNPSGSTVGGSGVNGGAPGRNYNDATPGPSATANTGGGGGAGADGAAPKNGGNGGSGLVILRYKYQN